MGLLQYSQPMTPGNPPLLVGETLPAATQGVFYSQNIATQASGGFPPYTFALLSDTGPDTPMVSSAGVITFTPTTQTLLADSIGFLVDGLGNYLSLN